MLSYDQVTGLDGVTDPAEAGPIGSCVMGLEDPIIDITEIQMIRLARNCGEGARVAAIRTDRAPDILMCT